MTASLLVPLSEPLDPIRAEHWTWLRRRWQAVLPPSWEIVEASSPSTPWCKANAVERAAQQALHRTWVIADADVIVDPAVLEEGARRVAAGAAWVHPHRLIYRLSPPATERTVAADPDTRHADLFLPTNRPHLDRNVYPSGEGGGLVILSAAAYRTVRGFDPRFVGWGGEDVSFGRALRTLCGPPVTLDAHLWHLWHPPQPRPADPHPIQRKASRASDELSGRYVRACGDVDAMAALVAEHQEVTA